VSALDAAALASLADWIDDRLGNEHADRQTICEDVAAQLRDMAAAVRESRVAGAELEARKTAAAAVVADFKRETDESIDAGGPLPNYQAWAWRLYTSLGLLLDGMEAPK
jgi:hypothetical protein